VLTSVLTSGCRVWSVVNVELAAVRLSGRGRWSVKDVGPFLMVRRGSQEIGRDRNVAPAEVTFDACPATVRAFTWRT
jgi:hypothetical protein